MRTITIGSPRQRALARHLLSAIALLLAVTFATFVLIRLTPGNTATAIAVRQAGPGATQQQIDFIRETMRLDDSLLAQYGVWLGNAMTGDFGLSEKSGRPVSVEIADKLPRTLFLGLGGAVTALIAGFGAGIVSAITRKISLAGSLRFGALLGVSIPTFWMSFLLIFVFAEKLRWLPTSGQAGPASWIMPWLVLAIPAAGTISRVVSVALTETMEEQYVTAAKARGVAEWSPIIRDALPNAIGATLNVTALQLGMLFTGSVIVETVFAWPGIGNWFVESVKFRDNWAILASVMIFGVGFIVITRTVDAIQIATDPRLRRPAVA